jgi:hypothetical protein
LSSVLSFAAHSSVEEGEDQGKIKERVRKQERETEGGSKCRKPQSSVQWISTCSVLSWFSSSQFGRKREKIKGRSKEDQTREDQGKSEETREGN